jgi:LytS/YehU family sensor histidine kinase
MRKRVNHGFMVILRILARLGVIILVYAGAFLMYFLLRDYPLIPNPIPFQATKFFPFEIHQQEIGFFLQITAVPVLLFLLLSYLPYFRKLLQDQAAPHATLGVLLGLAAVQLISQACEIWISRSTGHTFFISTFVILIGSLIGGWRIGLLLGAVSMAFQSGYELYTQTSILGDLQAMGAWKFLGGFYWVHYVFSHLINPHFSGGVWMAVFTCLTADFLGPRRYSPWAASAIGVIMTYAVETLRYVAGLVPAIENSPALVTGFAAALVMLMIRTLQVEASRRRAAEAELLRMQAELRALRAQINPHFFFNALNTIRYMIREDPQTARDLMIDLSEIFQRTLRSGDFVPLRDELGYVEAYFSLEKARLGDRLRVVWGGLLQPDKPLETETPLLDSLVPTLALQPIVENAVIHGIGKKKDGGTVSVCVDRQKDDLVITIEDDGVGMDGIQKAILLQPSDQHNTSIGLKNVDARLRRLYGSEYGLAVESEPEKGTRVTIRVPIAETEGKK